MRLAVWLSIFETSKHIPHRNRILSGYQFENFFWGLYGFKALFIQSLGQLLQHGALTAHGSDIFGVVWTWRVPREGGGSWGLGLGLVFY